jgi:hypothetical protein
MAVICFAAERFLAGSSCFIAQIDNVKKLQSKKGVDIMSQENNFLTGVSLVELLKQEMDNLKKLLSYFDSAGLSDKFPDKTQRLNKAFSDIDSGLPMRRAMESRYMFIKGALALYFNGSPEAIGIDKILFNNIGEILNHN